MGFCFAVSFYFSCNNKVSICNSVNYRYRVVVATAKVQIFKQITTLGFLSVCGYSCCCYRKGTNFQANHNINSYLLTGLPLLLLPQRYKFSSKSQQLVGPMWQPICCCCYRKGTNFQANHNWKPGRMLGNWVVVATAKVQIFKQITTNLEHQSLDHLLLLLPQRYKFSSKSQLYIEFKLHVLGCCCYRKGTNFQANHNRFQGFHG